MHFLTNENPYGRSLSLRRHTYQYNRSYYQQSYLCRNINKYSFWIQIQPNIFMAKCIFILHSMLHVLYIHCLNTHTCKVCMIIKYYKHFLQAFKAIIQK